MPDTDNNQTVESKWMYDQLVEEHGEVEAKRIMSERGSKGGSKRVKTKGFGSNPELARKAGRKGKPTKKAR